MGRHRKAGKGGKRKHSSEGQNEQLKCARNGGSPTQVPDVESVSDTIRDANSVLFDESLINLTGNMSSMIMPGVAQFMRMLASVCVCVCVLSRVCVRLRLVSRLCASASASCLASVCVCVRLRLCASASASVCVCVLSRECSRLCASV